MRGGAARRSFELLVETGVLAVLSPYLAGLLEGEGSPAVAPPVGSVVPRATVALIEYDDEDPAEHDPDDPDEELEATEETEAEAETETEEGAEELDPEEQAWHRVWADEPAARPASAAPVRLSFVPSGAELVRRRQIAWAALPWIDKAVTDGRDPSNAVAFGVLLAPFLSDELRGADLHAAVNELAHPMIVQLHVTRRDSERLRYLLIAQRKLAAAKKRGVHAELSGGREMIDDAVMLFELLERAAGNEPSTVPTVAPNEGRSDETDDDDPNRPRKRRRRRRGGRRRRSPLPAIETHARRRLPRRRLVRAR